MSNTDADKIRESLKELDRVVKKALMPLDWSVIGPEAVEMLRVADRIIHQRYPVEWGSAGGPNECEHGYAAGIPCERCDTQGFNMFLNKLDAANGGK